MNPKNNFFELPIPTRDGQFVARYSEKGLAGLNFPNGRADLPVSPDARQRIPTAVAKNLRELFDDRNDPAQFFCSAHRLRAGSGGFAANVEDFRALRDQLQRVRDGFCRAEKFSAVGKRIGRDVDDAHDQRRSRENKFKLSGAEKHLEFTICNLRFTMPNF